MGAPDELVYAESIDVKLWEHVTPAIEVMMSDPDPLRDQVPRKGDDEDAFYRELTHAAANPDEDTSLAREVREIRDAGLIVDYGFD